MGEKGVEVRHVFHYLWTQAVGQSGYNKDMWAILEAALLSGGVYNHDAASLIPAARGRDRREQLFKELCRFKEIGNGRWREDR